MCTSAELAQFIILVHFQMRGQMVNPYKKQKSDYFFSLNEGYFFTYLSPLMEATSWAQVMNLCWVWYNSDTCIILPL